MDLRCPHCQNPIDRADLPSGGEVSCIRCGSSFQLANTGKEYFVARNKQKLGPFTWAHLRSEAANGAIVAADMILEQGAGKWVPAASVPGLFLVASTAPETVTAAGPTPPGHGAPTVSFQQPKTPVRADPAWPQVPGYRILGVLGRGGMGVVYKAQHLQLKRLVALKMVLTGSMAGADELSRFRLEAEAVARLQHPNIVQIHEIGEHAGRPYFSLEFVEGGSLASRLVGDPQPPRQAAELIEILARAMHAAHERGIVHRDLKPGNVLLTNDGNPKVADFGLAKQLDADQAQTQTGAIMGTPSYMAPEQAAGKTRDIGPKCDVYALGVILYELLTGRAPFKGETTWDTLDQVCNQDPVPPSRLQPKVPRDLETICLKCLAKAPAGRYASAQELAEDLRRFVNGEPVKARPLSAAGRALRWGRRHPVIAAASMASVVLLLVFATYWGTRPAYLDIRVEPKTAEVLLDGVAVPLEDGRGLVASGPGRHEVKIRAPGHLVQEQPVMLVRGRDNAALVNVRLESEFGFFQASTSPSGATVRVFNDKNNLVDEGMTPYNSPRLVSGAYRVKFQLGLHEDADATAVVPTGDRLTRITPVALKSVEGATESQALIAFLKKTRDTKLRIKELEDRYKFKLGLQLLSKRFNIPFRINEKALRFELSADHPDPSEVETPAIAEGTYSPLEFLRHMCTNEKFAFVPVKFAKGEYGFELVGRQYAAEQRILVMYPLRDYVDEKADQKQSASILAQTIAQFVEPGSWSLVQKKPTADIMDAYQPGTMTYAPATNSLYISHCWAVHEEVYARLEEIRLARLSKGK